MTGSTVYGSKFRYIWSNKGVRFSEIQSSMIHSMFSNDNGLYAPVLLLVGYLGLKRSLLYSWFCHWPNCCLSQITSFPYVCLISKALPAGISAPPPPPLHVYTVLYKVLPWCLDSICSLQKWCITAIRTGNKTYGGALFKNPRFQTITMSFSCLEDCWLFWLLLVVFKVNDS